MALEARRSTTETTSIEDRAFKGVGDLIRVLPSGTVFLFQFLSPLLTNAGHCTAVNKWLSGALLLASGFSCAFSSFTDSFVDPADGKVYYGVVTKNGMWAFSDPNAGARDLSEYRLRLGDFVHASLALLVFAALALLDNNTVSCFYPSLLAQEKTLVTVLPTVVGAIAASVFMVFPNNRHGIGYPPSGTTTTTTAKPDLSESRKH
ncbi:hypothetical protein Cni_G21358 [Canna indica]|uniref:Uncharacterized protein n=1 Tax=Canna indica TaxID=4628 RepID=A0AAQ3QH60_9LILI|nr:hypothetical protein Cni_G21358 [Canna indica]